jgi:hypothetical protein
MTTLEVFSINQLEHAELRDWGIKFPPVFGVSVEQIFFAEQR